ncbi:biotin--[acetyl-CoA-carboxylase] ligase [Paenibacillus motobuensis]|uniref:biotin--[acetyl-CoA-carboxylase] ligase n=1 Tax=Paenibacillus TaxID=44249 RepID=UPI002041DE4D|nr:MULTISPECIES: biotin--[acetyl-CoA-carboxylase] ligase [Paenibacillus]MCM3040114.1 biotin--[acetyl-CoA-carboxylase] ligase [Paenibacillus lutimineralis]MCM3647218.1 biotin--[acetyl-CoA-carboxylase] ligase [Paenibacillus motobuensis]
MESNRLLQMLLDHPGQYISGEELSRRLSISRTAVWKQINKLRQDGYEFDAVSRKGYRLVHSPERIHEEDVLSSLQTVTFGRQIHVMDVVKTTQDEVRALAEQGAAEGTLVIAEEQTVGRGRQGRKWYSPSGKGIWMSMLLKPRQPIAFAAQLTLLTAVGVCRALRKVSGVDVGIKWPNDLLIEGRKLCGILVESISEDELLKYCIVGIGIDVNQQLEDIPEEIRSVATSLRIESDSKQDRTLLIAEILYELEQLYNLYNEEGFAPIGHLWEALSVTIGRQVQIRTPQGETSGYATGLDPSGALLITDQHGKERTIYSGEIQLGRI